MGGKKAEAAKAFNAMPQSGEKGGGRAQSAEKVVQETLKCRMFAGAVRAAKLMKRMVTPGGVLDVV